MTTIKNAAPPNLTLDFSWSLSAERIIQSGERFEYHVGFMTDAQAFQFPTGTASTKFSGFSIPCPVGRILSVKWQGARSRGGRLRLALIQRLWDELKAERHDSEKYYALMKRIREEADAYRKLIDPEAAKC